MFTSKLDREEAQQYFKEQDKDGDDKVTIDDITKDYYGHTTDEVVDWEQDGNEEMRELSKVHEILHLIMPPPPPN